MVNTEHHAGSGGVAFFKLLKEYSRAVNQTKWQLYSWSTDYSYGLLTSIGEARLGISCTRLLYDYAGWTKCMLFTEVKCVSGHFCSGHGAGWTLFIENITYYLYLILFVVIS
jgi:hypothetical protein